MIKPSHIANELYAKFIIGQVLFEKSFFINLSTFEEHEVETRIFLGLIYFLREYWSTKHLLQFYKLT